MAESDSASQDDYMIQSFWCKALYDYTAQDTSALSFRRGDIIEVLSKQRSGWWDGLLGDERGWFPSNYVQVISDEEAEAAFSGSELDTPEQQASTSHPTSDSQLLDMSAAMMSSIQSDSEEWLTNELAATSGDISALANATIDSVPTQIHDFWMPEVTDGGQIYYVNTQTGQRSRDLPRTDAETSDDLVGLTSQSSSRSGTSAGLGYASEGSNDTPATAGFGVQRSTGTPEPWIRKLADDGYSYYYFNQVTQDVQWTRPENGDSFKGNTLIAVAPKSTRNRSSVYSDSSDIQPDLFGAQNPRTNGHTRRPAAPIPVTSQASPPSDILNAENIAHTLQQELAPPPRETVTDLAAVSRNAIQAIINSVHSKTRKLDDDDEMEGLILAAVDAVRNLLYISAAPAGQIPNNVIPRDARDPRPSTTSQSPLKPAQRKVTATLSRLVLSARAMQYDAGSVISDTLNRIEIDAEELERAIMSFVLEVQRMQHASPSVQSCHFLKRLQGALARDNIGLGLVGAGAAGSWTGFGFVPLEPGQSPQRKLSQEVVAEMASYLQQLEGYFNTLGRMIQASLETPVEDIRVQGQDLVTFLSSFYLFVCNIHVAKHVDVSGVWQEMNQVGQDMHAQYMETVERARLLIRTLEAAVQSLFDEGMAFFLLVQSLREIEPGQSLRDRNTAYDNIDSLSTSLKSNLAVVQQTLEALLSAGHEQADLAQGDYLGSIEMQLNRLSEIRRSSAILVNDRNLDSDDALHPSEPSKGNFQDPYSSESHQSASELGDQSEPSAPEDSDEDEPEPVPKKADRRKKDLTKVFGHGPPASDPVPWYLQPDYDPKEIVLDTDLSVKGGTVPALVARLTAHEHQDSNYLAFQRSFLMTFKSFTTVDELFDLLVSRFWIQPPPNLTAAEKEKWANLKQRVIQARVLNTFKSLISDEDVLDKEDFHILDRIKDFTQKEEVYRFVGAKTLAPLVERAQRGESAKVTKVLQGQPPPPILPKAGRKLRLLDIEPLEMARQLTILESRLYQKIRPMECLQRAREQRTDNMDNIANVIQTSNRIADWVAESILTKEDSRRRAAAVKHLISIADRCRTMNNFSTMIAITSGLNTPPIRRLKRTWEQVNQKVMAQFTACEMTIDSSKNFHKYRQLMATVTPPCVPFIGVFLSTLQFIHDGNSDTLQPGNLVNFKKRQKASEVISDIQRWQQTSFNFTSIPAIQQFIEESLSQFQDTKASSEHFWSLSLEREPREREDEKMARLLQESGFL